MSSTEIILHQNVAFGSITETIFQGAGGKLSTTPTLLASQLIGYWYGVKEFILNPLPSTLNWHSLEMHRSPPDPSDIGSTGWLPQTPPRMSIHPFSTQQRPLGKVGTVCCTMKQNMVLIWLMYLASQTAKGNTQAGRSPLVLH